MARTVQPGDTVLLHYRLSTPAGEEISGNLDAEPETFVVGAGELAQSLEACLIGLAEGSRASFSLGAAEAFGEADPGLVREISREDFPSSFPLIGDSLVEFQLPDGRTVNGVVKSWTEQSVTVDFNHPLSGCPVVFEVEVIGIC